MEWTEANIFAYPIEEIDTQLVEEYNELAENQSDEKMESNFCLAKRVPELMFWFNALFLSHFLCYYISRIPVTLL